MYRRGSMKLWRFNKMLVTHYVSKRGDVVAHVGIEIGSSFTVPRYEMWGEGAPRVEVSKLRVQIADAISYARRRYAFYEGVARVCYHVDDTPFYTWYCEAVSALLRACAEGAELESVSDWPPSATVPARSMRSAINGAKHGM